MKQLTCLALSLISFNVFANTVHYDEQIDGDLGTTNFNLGALSSGTHKIFGTTSYKSNYVLDFDGYLFDIEAGSTLTSYFIESRTITKLAPEVDVIVGYYFKKYEKDPYIENSYTPIINYGIYYFPVTPGLTTNILDELSIAGELSEGTYGIRPYVLSGVTIDYTYTIGVTAVPLPASIWLFITGLTGIFSVMRHKKALPIAQSTD